MKTTSTTQSHFGLSMLLAAVTTIGNASAAQHQKPNIVIIWGDDIGQSNISATRRG